VETSTTLDASPVYLAVDEEVVYKIAPNSVLNIGRLETNDIVLDDYKVSREHAVLKFAQSEIVLIDLVSTHGTYVNGTRIDRAVVQFGDTIRIVSHELVLRRDLPGEIRTDTGSIVMPRMTRSLDRRLKFFGGLNEFSLLTLVQFLHQERQSGLLLLELGQTPGPRIYIQDGDIIHVSQGDNLAELLVRKNHELGLFFYFHHETNFPKRTIMASTPTYLMNLCHSIDERKLREREAAAAAAAAEAAPVPEVAWASKPHPETALIPLPPFVW
jgi:hypothetical protein